MESCDHIQSFVYRTDINVIRLQVFSFHVFRTKSQPSLSHGISEWTKDLPILINRKAVLGYFHKHRDRGIIVHRRNEMACTIPID